MNKTLLFCAAMYLSLTLSAQAPLAFRKNKPVKNRATVNVPGKQENAYWDSGTNSWSVYDSIYYTYNNSARPIEELHRFNNNLGFKTVKIINGLGQILREVQLNYNSGTSSYDSLSRTDYEYNQQGDQSAYMNYSFGTGSAVLSDGNRSTYVFNTNNQITSRTDEFYDSGNMIWVNSSRQINFSYDGNGNLLARESEDWNGSVWEKAEREQFTYVSNVLSVLILQEWNGMAYENALMYDQVTWYQYNANLEDAMASAYTVSSYNGTAWEPVERFSATYQLNGSSEGVTEEYDGSTWFLSKRSTEIFDVNGYVVDNHYLLY